MSTLSQAQRSFDRQLPPDPKPVEFTLEDWASGDLDGFNEALADVMADEAHDLVFNRQLFGPNAGHVNLTPVIVRMEGKLARLEHSIMPPRWMTEKREQRNRED